MEINFVAETNKRHKYLLIDTETANSMDDPLVYNLAGAVIDQHGGIYEIGSFINRDIFVGERDMMDSAYYASKIPQYIAQIHAGEIQVKSWYEIKIWVREMCEKWNIKAIIAHNARFDYKSCSCTQRYETSSKYRFFFPYGVEIWDTMKMAQDTICEQPTYKRWCEKNGYCLPSGKPRKTAEILYRYINDSPDFVEEHKALEDVLIECAIFWHCIRQHKHMARKCFKDREQE